MNKLVELPQNEHHIITRGIAKRDLETTQSLDSNLSKNGFFNSDYL